MRKNRVIQFSLLTVALGLIFFTYYYKDDKDRIADFDKKISAENVGTITEETSNIIENVKYSGESQSTFFELNAAIAEIKQDKPNISFLSDVFVVIKLKGVRTIHIRSDKAIFNKLTNDSQFFDNVEVTEKDNIITSDNLDLYMSQNLISAYNNLNVKFNDVEGLGFLSADRVDIDILKNEANIFMFEKEDKVSAKYNN